MRKLLVAVAITSFVVAATASATSVTISLDDLDDVYLMYTNNYPYNDNVTNFAIVNPGDGDGDQDYRANYWLNTHTDEGQQGDPQFVSGSYGFNFWGTDAQGNSGNVRITDTPYHDLTGYDELVLILSNELKTEGEYLMGNLFINTGWTDPGWGEPDNFYENGWTWIPQHGEVVFTLDLTSVANLNHVSAIGFMIGTNVTTSQSQAQSDPYLMWEDGYGAEIEFNAEPVPEPTSMALLGLGLAGFVVARLRRRII